MKLKKYEKNPIIAPNPANAWENLVTCNPGVIYDDGRFYMLYRAAGDDKEHVIRLGLAVSENGFDFRRVGDSPVFGPSADGPDGGCVEDPRIVKFDNEFYITYAYRAHAPGQYWTFAHDVVRLPRCGAYAPAAMAQNLGNTGLAVTSDFRNFRRLGRLTSPVLDDRDVILFPEKIGGKFAMMHRPKQFVGMDCYQGINNAVFVTNLKAISKVSLAKLKPCGVTETGVEGFTATDYWTTNIHAPLTGRRVSMVVTWRNKYDPMESGTHYFSVFPGHPSERDFVKMYNQENSFFCSDLPDMYTPAENVTVL